MCFIISIIMLILSFNFFLAENIMLALLTLIIAIFFIYLMLRNIQYVKKLKKGKENDS